MSDVNLVDPVASFRRSLTLILLLQISASLLTLVAGACVLGHVAPRSQCLLFSRKGKEKNRKRKFYFSFPNFLPNRRALSVIRAVLLLRAARLRSCPLLPSGYNHCHSQLEADQRSFKGFKPDSFEELEMSKSESDDCSSSVDKLLSDSDLVSDIDSRLQSFMRCLPSIC